MHPIHNCHCGVSCYNLASPTFSSFLPGTETNSPASSCIMDHIRWWLLKQHASVITPVLVRLCNRSPQSGIFPTSLKYSIVLLCLKKKPNHNPESSRSYRPIPDFSYLSIFVKYVVSHRLLPSTLFAYRTFHSTKTMTSRPTRSQRRL